MNENNKNINSAAEDAETSENGLVAIDKANLPANAKDVVEDNEGGNPGVYVHEFRRPFEYEGKTYKTLNFYFERLTGRDVISIENEMQAHNEYALDPLLSRNFQSKMASRASGVGTDVLEAMPIQEFNKIVSAARNFLIETSDT